MNAHPNATAGAGGTGLGILIAWLLNKYTNANLNPSEAATVAGGVSAFVLVIGREGIDGLWRAIRHGTNAAK